MRAKEWPSSWLRWQRRPALCTPISTSSWSPSWTSKMAGSSQLFIHHPLLKGAHSAIVCGQTGCGKTVFILFLLEEVPYRGFFRHIVVLCPNIEHNKTYKQCPLIWTDPEVYVLDPCERLQDYLRAFHPVFKGEPKVFYNRRLLGDEGSDEEEKHAVRFGVLGPPRRHKRLGFHPEIQFSPEGLPRADELGRTLPLQGSRQLWRMPAGERRDTDSRTACVGAAAASRKKTRQASVENRSACCLYSCVAMLPVTEGLLVAVLGTHLVLLVFVAWQIEQCLRRVALHIRRTRRLVIGEMDCDDMIDDLMSVADP